MARAILARMSAQERVTIRLIPIGIDDFRALREKNYEYIDKTNLVTSFIDGAASEVCCHIAIVP